MSALTPVGSTTLDGVQRAPSGGLALWDYEKCFDIDVHTGQATRSSPLMPRESGEFSPFGVGWVDPKTHEFWVASLQPGHPKFRKLSADFSTWTPVGTTPHESSVFYTFGVVRVGDVLVTIVDNYGVGHYEIRGYALDGDTLLWTYTWDYPWTGSFNQTESSPECGTSDGERYIYWTVEGPYVMRFDALNHNSDPVAVVSLTDSSIYYEWFSGTDPRIDIDINGSFPANGNVYCWGSNEGYLHGSTNRNQVFAYVASGGGFAEIGEGTDDPTPNVTRNYRSFSGTCAVKDGKLYLLNDHLNPYISSFDLASGHYTTIDITLQGEPSFDPSALCGSFGQTIGEISAGRPLDTKPVYAPIRPLA